MATNLRIPIAGLNLAKANSGILKPTKSLYELISRLPKDGVGQRVTQARWLNKGIVGSYYTITKVRLRAGGTTGDVFGSFVWKGKHLAFGSKIRGGHKHAWKISPPPEPKVESEQN